MKRIGYLENLRILACVLVVGVHVSAFCLELLPVDSLFAGYPACTIGAKEERLCRCGSGFSVSAPDGVYRFYSAQGAFLMLGRVVNGQASTIKSFFEV